MNGETAKPQSHTIAALSYLLGLITGLLFLFLEPYSKDEFVRYHARQSVAFSVIAIIVSIVFRVLFAILPYGLWGLLGFLQGVVGLGFLVLWLLLMYKAYCGEKFRVPVLSELAESTGI